MSALTFVTVTMPSANVAAAQVVEGTVPFTCPMGRSLGVMPFSPAVTASNTARSSTATFSVVAASGSTCTGGNPVPLHPTIQGTVKFKLADACASTKAAKKISARSTVGCYKSSPTVKSSHLATDVTTRSDHLITQPNLQGAES